MDVTGKMIEPHGRLPDVARLRLEPADRLLDQRMVHDMDLDAAADAFEQRDGQLAAEMLLEVGEPAR